MITFMHLADAFIQATYNCIQAIHFSLVCVFPGNRTHNLLRFWCNALLLSHRNTWLIETKAKSWYGLMRLSNHKGCDLFEYNTCLCVWEWSTSRVHLHASSSVFLASRFKGNAAIFTNLQWEAFYQQKRRFKGSQNKSLMCENEM